MRAAYFNELDSYTEENGLGVRQIIRVAGSDWGLLKNPNFGFGSNSLSKGTRYLLTSFKNVPKDIVRAIVGANIIRKGIISNASLSVI
jgi:UDPglucose 6-dehydrogenase